MIENRLAERKTFFRKEVAQNLEARSRGAAILATPWKTGVLTVFFCALFLVVLIFISIMEIGDTVVIRGNLSPIHGAIKIYPIRNGLFREIRVKEGQKVYKGDILATVIAGSHNERGGDAVRQTINLLTKQKEGILQQIELEKKLLENSSNDLIQRVVGLERELALMSLDLPILEEKASVAHQEYQNAIRLQTKSFLSEEHVNQKKILWLNAKQQHHAQLNRIENQNNRINELKQQQATLPISAAIKMSGLEFSLAQISLRIMETENSGAYSLVAPSDGIVALVEGRAGEQARASTPAITLLPFDDDLMATLYTPALTAGSLAIGQPVSVIYDGYPVETYGTYDAVIAEISEEVLDPREHLIPIPTIQEPVYRIKAMLEQQEVVGSDTNELQSGMLLSAHIEIQKRTILERIFSSVDRARNKL